MYPILFEQSGWLAHEQHLRGVEQQSSNKQTRQTPTTTPTKLSNQLSASFLPENLSMDVKPNVKITTHSTDSTNSFDGAISCGDNELWAIVPNNTNAPIMPTNLFELNSPLSPLNISKILFIVLDRDTFSRVCYFLSERPCFCALLLVAIYQPMLLILLLPLFVNINAEKFKIICATIFLIFQKCFIQRPLVDWPIVNCCRINSGFQHFCCVNGHF